MAEAPREATSASKPALLLTSAFGVVARVVDSNPRVESLGLVIYHESPNWRDLPQAEQGADLPFLLRGLQQDRGERIQTTLQRREISAESLQALAANLPGHRLLAVISRVGLAGGKSGQIPMMDFKCPPTQKNQEVLTRLLHELQNGRGWLLESGRSYHYYASRILNDEEWKVFLGKCLLMSGYVDDRYIGHQLVDGHCVLRLSSGKLKARSPKVVAEFS
jgi:hypothetical protein